MSITRFALGALLLLGAALPTPAAAITPADGTTYHVRTTDLELRALIADGVRRSPTFRGLVERLVGSDVVVYVHRWQPRSGADGSLTFAATAGGYRYVVVRVNTQRPSRQVLALLGHELRHAVEVAETPAIVDGASLAREYARLGHVSHLSGVDRLAFDTPAAIATGYQVLLEVQGIRARPRRQTVAVNTGARGQSGMGTEMNP